MEEEGYVKRLVIALGGNAILRYGQAGTMEEQKANLREASRRLAPIIASWYQVVITHGNGPQVGNILLQNEKASEEVPAMPLDVCGAESQGQIGYLLQQVLGGELRDIGKDIGITALLTLTKVDPNDPAFEQPCKPVGPWYSQEGMISARKKGETWVKNPAKGWRKVVPSPRPIQIVNAESIKALLRNGEVVVACGGGGVPVTAVGSQLRGVEAVIDKDLASECLATQIRANILIILTDVQFVYVNYGTPDERPLGKIHVKSMRELYERGLFAAGSIGPKVEAALRFVESGGERAVISNLESATEAIKGKVGTTVYRNNQLFDPGRT
ncbi:MAG: carbamate kinase [Desulfobacterales bacterium]|nr:carbamate kinase [Desulfobacterales bacterium]